MCDEAVVAGEPQRGAQLSHARSPIRAYVNLTAGQSKSRCRDSRLSQQLMYIFLKPSKDNHTNFFFRQLELTSTLFEVPILIFAFVIYRVVYQGKYHTSFIAATVGTLAVDIIKKNKCYTECCTAKTRSVNVFVRTVPIFNQLNYCRNKYKPLQKTNINK